MNARARPQLALAPILALETCTDSVSLALHLPQAPNGHRLLTQDLPQGPHSSSALLPAAQGLLAQAGLRWQEVGALAFGRGPGAFTGVRVGCAVAQGAAFAHGLGLWPCSSLLALAEAARADLLAAQELAPAAPVRMVTLLDARMRECYGAVYDWLPQEQGWQAAAPEVLVPYAQVSSYYAAWARAVDAQQAIWLVGNVRAALAQEEDGALPDFIPYQAALPTAQAYVRLALQQLAQGQEPLYDAAAALPVYVRDKVALTSAERAAGQKL